MADLLTSIRAEIGARLRELEPAIAEFEQLSTAARALDRGRWRRPRDRQTRQARQSRQTCQIRQTRQARQSHQTCQIRQTREIRETPAKPRRTRRPGRRSSRRSSTARTRSPSWSGDGAARRRHTREPAAICASARRSSRPIATADPPTRCRLRRDYATDGLAAAYRLPRLRRRDGDGPLARDAPGLLAAEERAPARRR